MSNKSEASDRSPLGSSRMNFSAKSPGIGNNRRNFSFHTQHIGSIISNPSQRMNANSVLSNHSKTSDGGPQHVEADNTSDLVDISRIVLPNYDSPKCSSK